MIKNNVEYLYIKIQLFLLFDEGLSYGIKKNQLFDCLFYIKICIEYLKVLNFVFEDLR